MANFTAPKHSKRNNRKLMREISILVSNRAAQDEGDSDYWDNYEDVEPIIPAKADLTD